MQTMAPETVPMAPGSPIAGTRGALDALRVVVVAGVGLGVLVGGIGGRLAMLLLRVTSPDHVVGLTSDDGFRIGQVTLAGTYSLFVVGAGVGLIGAAVYGLVAPWLIGPGWFQRVTVALGSGAVVGGMLVHTDGVDFTALRPTWLAIALFVAVPALFGALVGPVRDRLARPDGWSATGWRRWGLPAAAVAAFPPTIVLVGVIGAVMLAWAPVRSARPSARVHANVRARTAVQAGWLLVAVLGLVGLVADAATLT